MLSTDLTKAPVNVVNRGDSASFCDPATAGPESAAAEEQPRPAPISGKQRRACLKKQRRKRKRQALAKLRECDDQPEVELHPDEEEEAVDQEHEELRERLHQEWLEREQLAQEEFRLKREREEATQKRKEEEERRIKEEWEEQQRKETEALEQKRQEKKDREEAVQKLLDQAESQLKNGGSWKNPDAPTDYGTERDKANCPFYLKTGACRFGDRCSRKHHHPESSTTLMVHSMFVTFAMEQIRRDDYDTDAGLEYSEEDLRQQFLDFYDDVLPEFRTAGKVVQFKVSCNFEPHLRGNVYVQYESEDECKQAFVMFNGRWYAGRQLHCEFCPVTRWKTAICGLFDRHKCPKGKHCNFLHVFRNPSNEFWEADRDLNLSPDRSEGFTSRHRLASVRAYSPELSYHRRSERRGHSRERYNQRKRSRSRGRRSRSRSRVSQRAGRSLNNVQGYSTNRGRSRSPERRCSDSRGRDGRSVGKSKTKSPSSRRHKSSKKSKKKSKKKQKRKRSRSSSGSSSDFGKDSEDGRIGQNTDQQETETADGAAAQPLTPLHDAPDASVQSVM